MKKFFYLILLCFITLLGAYSNTYTSKAQGENYYRIISTNSPFFANETDLSPMFYLPYTYYVNVLEETETFFHIEIGTPYTSLIDGYTYKSNLLKDDLSVSIPYPEIKVIIKDLTIFYKDPSLTQEIRYLFKDRLTDYFGKIEVNGETILCVGYGGTLGYVKYSAVYPFEVENHPNPLTFLDKDEEKTEVTEQTNKTGFILKLCVIICLFFAGTIGLFYAVKKKPITLSGGDEYENE